MGSTGMRWGVIGTGGFADAVFAPALQNAGQVLLGAAGSDAGRSAAFAERHGCSRTWASPAELLADPEVEAVWVASPNHLHAEHVESALAQGKHVLAEKPLATTGLAAQRLAALADRVDRRLAVGYQARFHPALAGLRDRARAGEFGTVASIRVSWLLQYPGLPDEWRLHPDRSGGWAIMDLGTHLLDAALWISGFPEAVVAGARFSTHHWHRETDELAVLLLEAGEATVTIEAATGVHGPANTVEVRGTNDWGIATGAFAPRLGPAGGNLATGGGVLQGFDDDPNPYEVQASSFASWVRGESFAGATGQDGAINVALIEHARRMTGVG